MHRVLVCDNVAAAGAELLRESAEVIQTGALTQQELITALRGCDALLVRSGTKVTAQALRAADALKVVARAGVGVDNIDIDAATHNGILVVNSPAGNILAAAEHSIAMLLAAARNIAQADASMKAGKFDRKRFMGRQIAGKTLGIMGLGKIGSEVARRATAFGLDIIAHDPYATHAHAEKLAVRLVEFEELLVASDFITVHVPLTDDTRGLIASPALSKMRPHAIVVNCARGGVIDEQSLLQALEEGRIAGAAVDVFEGEPEVDWALARHPRVVATPHLGASTSEAQETVAVDAARQILEVLAGRPPSSPVNVPALSPELVAQMQPYLTVAGYLGRIAHVLIKEAPSEVSVTASEGAPLSGYTLLISRLVAGLLAGRTDQPVNEVNAIHVARERGMRISHAICSEDPGYSRYVAAQIVCGETRCDLAAAMIEGDRTRILRIDGFSIDVSPPGRLMLVWKRNPRVPGFIGAIGSTLAQAGIGIASIEVGLEEIDGMGLLVAHVDKAVEGPVRDNIARHPEVARIEMVVLD